MLNFVNINRHDMKNAKHDLMLIRYYIESGFSLDWMAKLLIHRAKEVVKELAPLYLSQDVQEIQRENVDQ